VKISAIIPTYNRNEILLSRTLPSVFRQTRPVDEVIVVADGMEGAEWDGLEDAIRALDDQRIRLVNIIRPVYPEWPGDFWLVKGWIARNTGLDLAQGEYVAPLDDDDEWTDDHIELLAGAIETAGVDFAYGKSVTVPGAAWYGHWPPSGANFTDGSQLYRHDMGYRYDINCMGRGKAADQDLWDRMVEGGVTFTFVESLVHKYYPAA
jgi:glycosyltransferase involved in cell wall biosynthesis